MNGVYVGKFEPAHYGDTTTYIASLRIDRPALVTVEWDKTNERYRYQVTYLPKKRWWRR